MALCRRTLQGFSKTVASCTNTVSFHTSVSNDDARGTQVPLIIRTFRQALLTFDYRNSAYFLHNLNTLKTLTDSMKAEDLYFDRSFEDPMRCYNAPFTYIEVFQNGLVNMSIFVLRPGYTMPLHDHPQMHGLVKVISGAVRIQGFSEQREMGNELQGGYRNLFARMSNKIICDGKSETCVLTPTSSNFHEIQALDRPAAFFDILAPPYDTQIESGGVRQLGFYSVANILQGNLVQLQQIDAPQSFYCDFAPYLGPPLKLWETYKPSSA